VPLCVCIARYNVGTPAPDTCGQTINRLLSGEILSPTFPGMYPDHIFCFYKIHGAKGQRIKLTFVEIDLYSGGQQLVIQISFSVADPGFARGRDHGERAEREPKQGSGGVQGQSPWWGVREAPLKLKAFCTFLHKKVAKSCPRV